MRHRALALQMIAVALLVRFLVPAGFMPVALNGAVTLQPCSGFGPEAMVMAMPDAGEHHGKPAHADRAEMPCGFAGHAPAALGGADPILLTAAIVFIVTVLGRMPAARSVRRAANLRPHPRGPPALS